MTGRSPARLHLTDWIPGQKQINRKSLVPDWKTYIDKDRLLLPEAMKEQGYSTCFAGKWHLIPRPTPKDIELNNKERLAEIAAMYADHLPENNGFDENYGGSHHPNQGGRFFYPKYQQFHNMKGMGIPDKVLTDVLTDCALDFIERKQYGSVSMTERMFTRRGEWANQFGDYQRMGFWRFFHEQFGMSGPRFAFPLLLGVFGLWEMARRRHRQGIAYILLLLMATVGLVLYMNFSDGTKIGQLDGIDYLEVRDRDYFFTPGFMLFGLTIGLGLAIALQYLRESVAHFSSGPRRVIMGASVVVFLLPVFALANNYYYVDRSGNYIAYDYAHNLLSSAEENSVLFTLGDNDTFPLWCLQEAYGVRKDVAVVNLSLANTKWYIRQVRDYMNVPLGWSDDDIDNLRPFRTRDGKDFHLRSQLVDIILARALSVRPVGFSVTVSPDYRTYFGERIDSLLVLHGMTWRVQRQAAGAVIVNADYCYDYFTDPEMFRLRGFNDPSVYKDETSLRLTGNFGNGILLTADSLRKAGDFERATHLLEHSVEHLPFISRLVRYLASLYMEQGELEKLQTLVETDESAEFDQMHYMLGRTYQQRGMLAEAEEQFRLVLDTSPDYRPAFDELLRICYEAGEFGALRTILTDWIRHNPGDELAPQMLMEVEQELGRQADSVGKDDADSGAELE